MTEVKNFLSANDLANYFFELQKEINPTIIIEAGAFEASFSRKVAKKYPNINTWAFEANRHNYQKYASGALLDGVKYVYSAISSEVGETSFYYQTEVPNIVGNNSILSRLESNQYEEKVPSTTLDSFFIDSGIVDENDSISLWIDIEGASKEVLTNAEKLLKKTKSILIEVEHKNFWENQWVSEDVVKFLTSKGFILVARDKEYDPVQENYLFIKEV